MKNLISILCLAIFIAPPAVALYGQERDRGADGGALSRIDIERDRGADGGALAGTLNR